MPASIAERADRDQSEMRARSEPLISLAGARIVLFVRLAAPSIAVLVWLATVAASAQPIVVVRSESRLELDVRRGTDGALDVSGALRDDLGAALPDRDVALELSRANAHDREHVRGSHVTTRSVHTSSEGTFTAHFPTSPPPEGAPIDYVIDATYEGDAEHVGTRATRFFDVDRAHVALRLTIAGGARIDLSSPTHSVDILASSTAGGGGLAMTLSDEREAALGSGVTDASGTLHLELPSGALGPPAAGRLIVRTLGDAGRTEAQTEVPVVRYRPTRTTLELSATRVGASEPLRASGTLTDGSAPLEREAIGVFVGDTLVGTMLTGEDGRFATTISLEDLPELEGMATVRARFAGDAPWVPPSESDALPIEIVRPTSWAWLWALAPIVASLLVALWSLGRERAVSPRRARQPAGPGVAIGQRTSLAANRRDVAGTVLDVITGEPVADARLTIGDLATTSDARGRFAFDVPTRGAAELAVIGAEHLALKTAIALPHRGELSSLSIRLAGRRAATFAALRLVANHLSPASDTSAALTQRELLELLRSRGASPPSLPRLVTLVETACYGALAPSDDEMAEAHAIARSIAAEHGAPPAGKASPGPRDPVPRTER